MDRLLRSVDLDLLLLLALGDRDRLFRAGERDRERERWDRPRDLDRDRLRRALERDLRRRVGLLDFLFFLSGETDSFFLAGDFDLQRATMRTHQHNVSMKKLLWAYIRGFKTFTMIKLPTDLECFFLDTDLDLDLRGDEVDRESFLRGGGEGEGDLFSVALGGSSTGEEEFCSSTLSSEQSGLSGLLSGSLDADLDLETSCSAANRAGSLCSCVLFASRIRSSSLTMVLSAGGIGSGTDSTGFHPPAW